MYIYICIYAEIFACIYIYMYVTLVVIMRVHGGITLELIGY
jgi:hypothetical protein